MGKGVKKFRDLRIWQEGIALVKKVYSITKAFPQEEVYGLTSQMRRAVVSIPSNIAEGFRRKTKQFRHYLHITLASLAELETQVVISCELGYIKKADGENIFEYVDHISRMTACLAQSL